MSVNNQANSDDIADFEVIRNPIKLTKLDSARIKLESLEEKRAELEAKANPTSAERQRIAILNAQIPLAQERYARENKRAIDDAWRRRRGIDEWRVTDEGRASRRKVRSKPNADLSDLNPEQKEQHARDRRSDANWTKRQRDKGTPEETIKAALELRIETRTRERAEADELHNRPTFGRF